MTVKKKKPAVRKPHLAGKVKLTLTMTREAKDQAFAIAEQRGLTLGSLFSELVRKEVMGT